MKLTVYDPPMCCPTGLCGPGGDPALLATLGRTIDRPRWLARRLAWYHAPQVWERWARALIRHPWRALALGTLVIAAASWPLTRIRVGLPDVFGQSWRNSRCRNASRSD